MIFIMGTEGLYTLMVIIMLGSGRTAKNKVKENLWTTPVKFTRDSGSRANSWATTRSDDEN